MSDISFSLLVLYFTIYSVAGWVCETIWCSVGSRKAVNRGFFKRPLVPDLWVWGTAYPYGHPAPAAKPACYFPCFHGSGVCAGICDRLAA